MGEALPSSKSWFLALFAGTFCQHGRQGVLVLLHDIVGGERTAAEAAAAAADVSGALAQRLSQNADA